MKQSRTIWLCSGIFATTLLIGSLLLTVPNAYPEAYIGAQIGTSVTGNSLTDVELTDFSPNGTMSDRELSRSILVGGKIGYYFPQARWFGLETEVFYTTPNIKQQNTQITVQPGAILEGFGPVGGGTVEGVLSGDHFRVITWVPVNVMFRYHKMRLQPYAGVGMGLFFARVHTTVAGFEGTQSSTRIGLNAKAGLEYHVTRYLSAFGEWKYNRASFSFDSNSSSGAFGFDADYNVHFVAMGLNLHF
ncbi:MAG: outer membrane beta-barrel protein [Nitrospira sp.]|nr:outer membrane beta-barrel protein [Nitrospira sp.]